MDQELSDKIVWLLAYCGFYLSENILLHSFKNTFQLPHATYNSNHNGDVVILGWCHVIEVSIMLQRKRKLHQKRILFETILQMLFMSKRPKFLLICTLQNLIDVNQNLKTTCALCRERKELIVCITNRCCIN